LSFWWFSIAFLYLVETGWQPVEVPCCFECWTLYGVHYKNTIPRHVCYRTRLHFPYSFTPIPTRKEAQWFTHHLPLSNIKWPVRVKVKFDRDDSFKKPKPFVYWTATTRQQNLSSLQHVQLASNARD
jgi:hypothetical protein